MRQFIFFKKQFEMMRDVIRPQRTTVRPYTHGIVQGEGLTKISKLLILSPHQILEVKFCSGNNSKPATAAFTFGFITLMKRDHSGYSSVDEYGLTLKIDIAPYRTI